MKNVLTSPLFLCFLALATSHADEVTYSFLGSHGRQNNPSFVVRLKDGTDIGVSGGFGGPVGSDFPEINEYVANNPVVRGWFTFDENTNPYFVNGSSSYFNTIQLNFLLPPPDEEEPDEATTPVATFVHNIAILQNNTTFAPPDRLVVYGDNSSNPTQPFPTQLHLAGSHAETVIDLSDNFSSEPLPINGPILLHIEGPDSFGLELVDVTAAGRSDLITNNTRFPLSIDMRKSVPTSSRITVQFSGISTNFWLDPEDFDEEDFEIVDAWVKANVSKVAISEFLYYDLSYLESERSNRETVPTFANYYSASYVKTSREFLPPPYYKEQRRGGVGILQSRATLFSTHGGSASARADVSTAGGLSVGVQASASSSSGEGEARTVGFNTFRYTGAAPGQLALNVLLKGKHIAPSFGLPSGPYSLKAGMAVFDRAQFNSLLRSRPQDYLIDTDFDGLTSGPLAAALLADNTASLISGSGAVNITLGPLDSSGNRTLTANLSSGGFPVTPGGEFIVLLHLEASSGIGCLGGRCGASTIYLYDSLEFALVPFTTPEGTPVTNVIPAPEPPLRIQGIVNAPNELTINWAAVVGRVYQVQTIDDLTGDNWANWGEMIEATNNAATVTLPAVPSGERSFFRILGVE